MRTNGTNKKAFTFIELLVVISIIALLLSILMPSLQRVKAQALKTVCSSNLRQLAIAAIAYGASNDDKIPESCNLTGPNVWYLRYDPQDKYYNLFESYGPYVGEGNDGVWECPSAKRWRQADIATMHDELDGYVWTTYMYFPGTRFFNGPFSPPGWQDPYIPTPDRLSKARSSAVLFQDETRNRDMAPYAEGIIVNHNRRAEKNWHTPNSFKVVYDVKDVDGANLGFVDGSVSWHNGNKLIYIGYDQWGGWGGDTLSVKP